MIKRFQISFLGGPVAIAVYSAEIDTIEDQLWEVGYKLKDINKLSFKYLDSSFKAEQIYLYSDPNILGGHHRYSLDFLKSLTKEFDYYNMSMMKHENVQGWKFSTVHLRCYDLKSITGTDLALLLTHDQENVRLFGSAVSAIKNTLV